MTTRFDEVFDALKTAPRLLVQAELRPVQGDRFQPTGFPDLGAATYKRPDGTPMLLVESAQSMANHMESACWDFAADRIAEPLTGLQYVSVDLGDGIKTSSIQEAHRLNSIYIISDKEFRDEFIKEIKQTKEGRVVLTALASAVFKRDPNSIIHGVFFARSDVAKGRARLPRLLSGFVEGYKVAAVTSGGVKNENIDPTGDDPIERYAQLGKSMNKEEKAVLRKSLDAAKNIPYSRTEYTAEKVCAYFNFDLATMRGYRLGENENRLLIAMALFKILKLAHDNFKPRTACDLESVKVTVTRPDNVDLSDSKGLLDELGKALPDLIKACKFTQPCPITIIAPERKVGTAAKAREQARKEAEEDAKKVREAVEAEGLQGDSEE